VIWSQDSPMSKVLGNPSPQTRLFHRLPCLRDAFPHEGGLLDIFRGFSEEPLFAGIALRQPSGLSGRIA
jgi:hypothetical protein